MGRVSARPSRSTSTKTLRGHGGERQSGSLDEGRSRRGGRPGQREVETPRIAVEGRIESLREIRLVDVPARDVVLHPRHGPHVGVAPQARAQRPRRARPSSSAQPRGRRAVPAPSPRDRRPRGVRCATGARSRRKRDRPRRPRARRISHGSLALDGRRREAPRRRRATRPRSPGPAGRTAARDDVVDGLHHAPRIVARRRTRRSRAARVRAGKATRRHDRRGRRTGAWAGRAAQRDEGGLRVERRIELAHRRVSSFSTCG